jgi:Serine carboxypeptidase
MYSNPYGNASLGAAVTPSPDIDHLWNQWLNREDVQAAIFAKKPRVPHDDCSDIGYDVTWPSSLPDYAAAFTAGLKVLIFSGDIDVTTCPFASTQVGVDALTRTFPIDGAITRNWTAWQVSGVAGQQTGGYLELHKGFAFATIKAGGHEAPAFEPLASFQLINAFFRGELASLVETPKSTPPPAEAPKPRRRQSDVLREAMRKSQQRARDA